MLPKMMQKLFENDGSGPSLRADILPVDGTTLTINAQNKLEAKTSVTLSDAVDSDSSETAASSLAVKTAFEKAAEAQTAAAQANAKADSVGAAATAAQNTADAALARANEALGAGGGGAVTLSDAVDSDSSETAASSLAVKTAYDAAMEAQGTAEAATSAAQTAQTTASAAQQTADAAMQQALLGGSGGGAAVIEISEDKVMTVDDPRNLLVTATTPGLSITLPDASSIEADGIAFHIAVDGEYDVAVKDAQGIPVGDDSGMIAVGKTRLFLLMDKATGKWHVAQYGGTEASAGAAEGNTVLGSFATVFNTDQASYLSACSLSADKVLAVFRDESNSEYMTAVILTVSGTDMMWL